MAAPTCVFSSAFFAYPCWHVVSSLLLSALRVSFCVKVDVKGCVFCERAFAVLALVFFLDLSCLKSSFLVEKPRMLFHIFIYGSGHSGSHVDVGLSLWRDYGVFWFLLFDCEPVKQIHRGEKARRNYSENEDISEIDHAEQWNRI